jgi:FkbM family methyltransferase
MLSVNSAESLRAAFLRKRGSLPDLYLIDVGVSGGIHEMWRGWGDRLIALGVDVLESEIERLRAHETLPHVTYEAVKITAPPTEQDAHPDRARTNYALHRSAAYLGTALAAKGPNASTRMSTTAFIELWKGVIGGAAGTVPKEANYANVPDPLSDPFFSHYQRLFERSLAAAGSICYATRSATLDEIVQQNGLPKIDLMKIDTDGFELEVLRGASETLARGCLAVEVEVQFHGRVDTDANVFANIDTFLRQRGFTLMKLDAHCYGRSALPRPFVYPELPAQTIGGPIQWGDALYVRDLLSDWRPGSPPDVIDGRSVQVAAMLLDSYDLGDAAAELILAFPQCFGDGAMEFLDVLAKRIHGPAATYRDIIERFGNGVAGYRR